MRWSVTSHEFALRPRHARRRRYYDALTRAPSQCPWPRRRRRRAGQAASGSPRELVPPASSAIAELPPILLAPEFYTVTVPCGVYLWLESRAEITNVSYRTDSAIAPDRRSAAAERLDSSPYTVSTELVAKG